MWVHSGCAGIPGKVVCMSAMAVLKCHSAAWTSQYAYCMQYYTVECMYTYAIMISRLSGSLDPYKMQSNNLSHKSVFQSFLPTATYDDVTLTPDELLPAQSQSYVLGLMLKLPPHVLDGIHSSHSSPTDRLLHVLMEFLKQSESRPTWRAIVDALRSPAVNLPQLALKMETTHCLKHPLTCAVQSDTSTLTGIFSTF